MEVEKCILKMLKLGLVDLRAARSSTNFLTWLSILTQTFHQLYVCQRKHSNEAINMTHIWNKTLCVPTGLKVCVPSPEVEQSHPPHYKRVSAGFHQPRSKPIDQLTPFRIQPLMINITVAAGSLLLKSLWSQFVVGRRGHVCPTAASRSHPRHLAIQSTSQDASEVEVLFLTGVCSPVFTACTRALGRATGSSSRMIVRLQHGGLFFWVCFCVSFSWSINIL